MYIIYLSLLLIFIFSIISIISVLDKRILKVFKFSTSLLILSVLLFIIINNMRPNKIYVEEKITYYYNLKKKIDIVGKLQNEEFKNIFEDDLTKEMIKINKEIRFNKKNFDSKWIGCLCSEKLGKLEELSW